MHPAVIAVMMVLHCFPAILPLTASFCCTVQATFSVVFIIINRLEKAWRSSYLGNEAGDAVALIEPTAFLLTLVEGFLFSPPIRS